VSPYPVSKATGSHGNETERESDVAFVQSGQRTREFDGLTHEHDDCDDDGVRPGKIEHDAEQRDQPHSVSGTTDGAGVRQGISQGRHVLRQGSTVPNGHGTLMGPKPVQRV
jgi:hypothetical protein